MIGETQREPAESTFRPMGTSPTARALILAVDDDPAVGRAIERDLKRQYGTRYRVLLAD